MAPLYRRRVHEYIGRRSTSASQPRALRSMNQRPTTPSGSQAPTTVAALTIPVIRLMARGA